MIRRRQLVALLGGAVAWPATGSAQPAPNIPTIGLLGAGSASAWAGNITALVGRLRELGWVEGRTVRIEYRWADGRSERFAEIAAEFVRTKVDVVVTTGDAALTVKKATSEIPVVFALAVDPVGSGLVASLARPGGNATGLSTQYADAGGKKVELLRELVPGLQRLAIIANVDYSGSAHETDVARAAARALGLEVAVAEIRGTKDVAAAFESIRDRAQALYIATGPVTSTNLSRIFTFALVARLPSIYGPRDPRLASGGLMSYGPRPTDLFRRAGDYVDKILRGMKPADIPVEQPTKFELVINLTTAKALGLEVSPMLLARADEVIE
jgi:putative ABC transport system substrate-binding protein